VAALLAEAKEDLTAFRQFPAAHWGKLWSTNPAGAAEQGAQAAHQPGRDLPDAAAVTGLATAVLIQAPPRMADR
jgi:putative transposase